MHLRVTPSILDSQFGNLPGGMNEFDARLIVVSHENQGPSDVVDQQGHRIAALCRKCGHLQIEEIKQRISKSLYLTADAQK